MGLGQVWECELRTFDKSSAVSTSGGARDNASPERATIR